MENYYFTAIGIYTISNRTRTLLSPFK